MTMFSAAICANVEKSGVETRPHSANCAVPSGGAPAADPCHPLTGAVWREWSHSSDCLTSLAVQRHAVTAQGHVHDSGRKTRDDDAEVGNLKDVERLLLLLGERVLPILIADDHGKKESGVRSQKSE